MLRRGLRRERPHNPHCGPAYLDEPAQLLMNHCSRPAREVGEQVKPGTALPVALRDRLARQRHGVAVDVLRAGTRCALAWPCALGRTSIGV